MTRACHSMNMRNCYGHYANLSSFSCEMKTLYFQYALESEVAMFCYFRHISDVVEFLTKNS